MVSYCHCIFIKLFVIGSEHSNIDFRVYLLGGDLATRCTHFMIPSTLAGRILRDNMINGAMQLTISTIWMFYVFSLPKLAYFNTYLIY